MQALIQLFDALPRIPIEHMIALIALAAIVLAGLTIYVVYALVRKGRKE